MWTIPNRRAIAGLPGNLICKVLALSNHVAALSYNLDSVVEAKFTSCSSNFAWNQCQSSN
jgi:hypothetical protein